MEEIKKRKIDIDNELFKETFSCSSPTPDFISRQQGQGPLVSTSTSTRSSCRREDSNKEAVPVTATEITAETRASKMSGAGVDVAGPAGLLEPFSDEDDSQSAEQNSSGFCDEMGSDDKVDDGAKKVQNANDDLMADVAIFQTDSLSFSDRIEAYSEIFGGYSDVHHALHEYLSENVLFSGWRAIWKVNTNVCGKPLDECSILVEVDSALATLAPAIRAQVHLIHPFHCIAGERLCEGQKAEAMGTWIAEELKANDSQVDLIDLFPIYDESGAMDDTALAIEHARFFHQELWRPMDDEEDISGSSFLDKYLKQRLKFFYDVREKRVPVQVAARHGRALAECRAASETIRGLQSQLQDGDASDVELDLNESRIAVDIVDLHERVETLNRTLDKLESPFLRSLMSIPSGFLNEKSPEMRLNRDDRTIRTFLIAKQVTAGMIQDLNLAPDTIIEHCRSPGDALAQCYSGDTLLIFPGRYSGTGFYNVSQSVTIKGVGRKEEVVVVCEELADIFLDCEAPDVTISGLTLEDENVGRGTGSGLVAVRPGCRLAMGDCLLRSGALGATVFRGGALEMSGCEISEIKTHGLRCKAGSSIKLTDCLIHGCGLINDEEEEEEEEDACSQLVGGIAVEIQESDEGEDRTTLEVVDCEVRDNRGTGLAIFLADPARPDAGEPEPNAAAVIGLLAGVDVIDFKGNQFSDNLMGEAVLARADEP